MSERPDLPMPHDVYDGMTVVASTWLNDDEPEGATAVLLTLTHTPGQYYRINDLQWRNGEWKTTWWDPYPNIVPAVRAYEEHGGDQ